MRLLRLTLLPVFAMLLAAAAPAQQDRTFTTSDGVRLHYIEAGNPAARTIVFVPGWTMPAWIWQPQIAYFSTSYHVIAFDPRGQGASEVSDGGYEPARRGEDIADLLAHLGPSPVLLAGWSLGVLDALAYVHQNGDARLAGLVLVDNSVGEDPPPTPSPPHRGPKLPHAVFMDHFVRGMFRQPQSEAYLERLVQACLVTPEHASKLLLAYPVPRTYWREAVYATNRPVLYIVRPAFAAQADNLVRKHPGAESVVVQDAGHALFVDDAAWFNATLRDFIHRRIWP